VTIGGRRWELIPGDELVFGRDDAGKIIGVAPNDTHVSRIHGAIRSGRGSVWWLDHRSAKRVVRLLRPGEPKPQEIHPGAPPVPLVGDVEILVPTSTGIPAVIAVSTGDIEPPTVRPVGDVAGLADEPTELGLDLTTHERAVLAAVFAGYLRSGRRWEPIPDVDGAAEREWLFPAAADPKKATQRILEKVRDRLRDDHQISIRQGPGANLDLAAYLIGEGVLTADDLALIERPNVRDWPK
jgi:hypothetical protein